MPAWLMFLISAGVVAAAGVRLARDGDTIAEVTGLGGAWVGAILVAAATSLPELATDGHAVLQGSPGLAVGDLFGSSMANMAILAIADLLHRQRHILTRVAINEALVGTLALCLTILAALGIATGSTLTLAGVGWAPLVIGFIYVAGMRLLHRNREEPPFRSPKEVAEAKPPPRTLRPAVIGFGIAALAILVAARYVASSAADLAEQFHVNEGFVGMVLLAFTTSLPEVAVTFASVRRGAYNLAVGTLLGSNCFNIAALLPLDILNGAEALLAQVDPGLMIGALVGVLMMAIAMLDILNKSERRLWLIEPGPAFIVFSYVMGLYLTYRIIP
jgi:cation:H+ antiporter